MKLPWLVIRHESIGVHTWQGEESHTVAGALVDVDVIDATSADAAIRSVANGRGPGFYGAIEFPSIPIREVRLHIDPPHEEST